MKAKLYLLTIITVLHAMTSTAEEAVTVAIYDFTSNVGLVLPRDITALVTSHLSDHREIALVERARLTKALGEQALGLSGNVDFEAAAKVGQLTGAKVLVTGRAIKSGDELVITAKMIGTETSRVFSEKVQGSSTNLISLTSDLSVAIARTISAQSTNFVTHTATSHQKLLDDVFARMKGKRLPSVSFEITEKIPGERGRHETVQFELGRVFQAAGASVLDEKSDSRPDVILTGSALADGGQKYGNLFSCTATIEIKAQERKTGKILVVDRQQAEASDIGRQTAYRMALQSAADKLAVRLLPLLVSTEPGK